MERITSAELLILINEYSLLFFLRVTISLDPLYLMILISMLVVTSLGGGCYAINERR